MKLSLPFLLCFLCQAVAPHVSAAVEPEPGAGTRYEQADTDHDGRISRVEFLVSIRNKGSWWRLGSERANTGMNSATPEMFTALDRNRDGFLTREELDAGRLLRETRGDNSFGASGSRSVRPAPASQPARQEKPAHEQENPRGPGG